ncbi:MACPF domain-containing protein [Platanthera guangdongensis]|uniref:MACPF domain-containing protein n=1 Tax=Platanthera guangdongensis TaxID=2320717 RepID=A0ABR2LMX3_9ASPA
MALKVPPQKAAEIAIASIGLGYDVAADIRLKYCKRESPDPCLIELDGDATQDIVLPGGITVPSVPKAIKCDKGERMRFRSDVLSFQQMSEQFNQALSLSGKIPSGLFNHMFEFSNSWQKDAANTKTLAFDGWFITLYTVALAKSHIELRTHVKESVPSSWDPAALASSVALRDLNIVAVPPCGDPYAMMLLARLYPALHLHSSLAVLPATTTFEAKEQRLRFAGSSPSSSYAAKEDIMRIFKRRGGNDSKDLPHYEWLNTVQYEPDVISMSFIPITSLLNGVPGSGFLSHAINLYLRYKPPVEELHQFLEFQLPRQWAPVFSDLPLGPQRKQQSSSSLQFKFLGPKLYVNTSVVDVGKRPVTGLRLYLEGKRSNRLAIHVQHLSSLPRIFHLQDNPSSTYSRESRERKYYEPLQQRHFSHVCTAPIEADDDNSIVTGAQLHVGHHNLKKVLFLRLQFSSVSNVSLLRNPEWEGSPGAAHKSGLLSTLISTHFTAAIQKPPPRPADVNINSAVYPGGPPVPVQAPKLLKYIDTTEMLRGPQDAPGYWVVSGAKLNVERGKISLRVKYSLLTALLPDEEL